MPGLELWYRAIKAGWSCPKHLLQDQEASLAHARAFLARKRKTRKRLPQELEQV